MQIHSCTAFTAEKISGVLVNYSAFFVGTLPALKVFLHQIKCHPVDDSLVCVSEDQHILRVVLDTLFQFIGLAVSLEID